MTTPATNPFNLVMVRLIQNIPPQIRRIAVNQFNRMNHTNYTFSSFVSDAIMRDIVLPETNLSAGRVKTFPLKNEWLETTTSDHGGYAGDDGPYSLYRIPPEVRENKPITNILTVQYPYNTYLGGGINSSDIGLGGFCLLDQLDEVLNSYTLARPRNHPTAILLGGDLVRISPSQYSVMNWLLTVRISYDETFNNLHDNAIPILANLVMYATKQWIHTNLMIDIDRACMETGADIGSIKSTIEGYADAANLYTEEMVKWRGVSMMSPEVRKLLFVYAI